MYRSSSVPGRRAPRSWPRPSYRPEFDWLERRLLLTTDIWTGGGTTSNWSDAQNWSNGVPNAGDSLQFAGTTRLSSNNDLSSSRSQFAAISFLSSGFTLAGNPITLTNGISTSPAVGTSNTITFNIAIGSPVLNIGGSGDLVLDGTLSGAGGLSVNGPGTVTLAGTGSNTFTGTTMVNDGTLLLGKTGTGVSHNVVVGYNGSAPGVIRLLQNAEISSGSSLTVNSSGTLDLNGFDDTVANLTLASGTYGGAQVTTGVGTLTLGGNVTVTVSGNGSHGTQIIGNLDLGSATTTFAIARGQASTDLLINGAISANGPNVGLTETGNGYLALLGSLPNTFTGTTTVDGGMLILGKPSGITSIAGNLVIGSGSATNIDSKVLLTAGGQVSNHSAVTVQSDGQLNFNGHSDTFGSFNLIVSNANDSGGGSLRQALSFANTYLQGTSNVVFALPAKGTDTIHLLTALPVSTTPVNIDGTTQPGFAGTPLIVLDGSGITTPASGLVLRGGNSTVRGLAITYFSGDGIDVESSNDRIQGNQISDNSVDGVRIIDASGTLLGGLAVGAGNFIADNGHNGVSVIDAKSFSLDNGILSNQIFGNGGLGIDLGNDGPTPNHKGSAVGPNNFQNYPLLEAIMAVDSQVSGTLNATPNTTFLVQIFANSDTDRMGVAQGQLLLATITVTTDAAGHATFTATLPIPLSAGELLTATATDANRNTSEFAQAVQVDSAPVPAAVTTTPVKVPPKAPAPPPVAPAVRPRLEAVSSIPPMIVAEELQSVVTSAQITAFQVLQAVTDTSDPVTVDGETPDRHASLFGRELLSTGTTAVGSEAESHLKALSGPSGGSEILVAPRPKDERDAAGEIHGIVFEDYNGDGRRDRDEPLRQGEEVFLDLDGDGYYTPGEPIARTDAQGRYQFVGLPAGVYRVRRMPREQEPLRLTTPAEGVHVIIITPHAPIVNEVNFGLVEVLRRRRAPAPVVPSSPSSRLPDTPPLPLPPPRSIERRVPKETPDHTGSAKWPAWVVTGATLLLGLCLRRSPEQDRSNRLTPRG
jgi:autotransporter-associated beta strand protein/parallel beta-helix repeat protein